MSPKVTFRKRDESLSEHFRGRRSVSGFLGETFEEKLLEVPTHGIGRAPRGWGWNLMKVFLVELTHIIRVENRLPGDQIVTERTHGVEITSGIDG